MVPCFIIILLALAWLGYETDWLTVRLLYGAPTAEPIDLRALWIDTFDELLAYNYKGFLSKIIGEATVTDMPPFSRIRITIADYAEELSIGVRHNHEPFLCGMKWLNKNLHSLDNYFPRVELYYGNGYSQKFTLKDPRLMKQVIKINTGKKYFKELSSRPAH